MMCKYSHFFILTLFLLLSIILRSQQVGVEEYHQEDGLPTDLIKAFELDSLGYVWIATDGGVVRFEGKEFIQIENIENSSNYYKNLLFTNKYGYLAASDDGLIGIVKKEDTYFGEFAQNIFQSKTWPDLVYSKSLFEAKDSTIWIANNASLVHLTDTAVTSFQLPKGCHTDHYVRNHQFFEIGNSVFVVCQRGRLFKTDVLNNQLISIDLGISDFEVFSAGHYNDTTMLVGINDGLLELFFKEDGSFIKAQRLNFPYSASVIENYRGDILLGTWSHGLFRASYENNTFTYSHVDYSGQRTINDVLEDTQGQIWLATNFGLVLLRSLDFEPVYYDFTRLYIQDLELYGNKLLFTDGWSVGEVDISTNKLAQKFNQQGDLIIQLLKKDDEIWMTTNHGRIIIYDEQKKNREIDLSDKGQSIFNALLDREGNVWFFQNRETITLVKLLPDLTDKVYPIELGEGYSLSAMELNEKGELFVGARSNDAYLWKYNKITDSFENISHPLMGLKKEIFEVRDMAISRTGNIFIGSSEGVWKYTDISIERFELGNMDVESVGAITLDEKNRVWFVNSSGLVLYDREDVLVFNNFDGLPSKTVALRNLIIDSNNQIWLGTNLGLTRGKLRFDYEKTPKPNLRFVRYENNEFLPKSKTSFGENSQIDFYFSTALYPSKYTNYQYRLEGEKNTNWLPVEKNQRYVSLNHLAHGDYLLKIRSLGKGFYHWSDELEIEFTIYQHWYSNLWITSIIYLFIVLSVLIYIRSVRIKNEREKQKLEQIIKERTNDLQGQNEVLRQLNANLKEAKEEAEAAVKSKDRFFSILAHDLKSPFNTLIGFSEMLVHNRNDISEKEMQAFLEEMLKTSENTYKLLQNLLDWARSQTGALKIDKKHFKLEPLISEVLLIVDSIARQKNIILVSEISENIEVYADTELVSTVVRNLLINAIKFSYPKNSVKIKAIELDDAWVEILVVDNGMGISKEKLTDLFTIDKNVSTPGTLKEKGTGLGLILCKEFVERCNGKIQVQSQPEIGTTFTVRLPKNRQGIAE